MGRNKKDLGKFGGIFFNKQTDATNRIGTIFEKFFKKKEK